MSYLNDNKSVNTLGYESIKSYGRVWSIRKEDRIFSILKCSQYPTTLIESEVSK